MADESHGQMMLQQQPSQQSAQMQQSQQIQQSQLQQQQMQQSIQQAQIQQQQQQIQQAQIQQQQQPQMQQSQQQTVASTMPMANNTVEQSNHMNATTSLPMNVINVSQAQQMPTMQQNVNTSVGAPVQLSVSQLNTSGGTPVQMAVSQLNTSTGQPVQMTQLNTSTGQPVQMTVPQIQAQAQTVPAGTMMSQSSGPHPTMIHPTMSMAQAPLQQVQVIQQPLSASYLQHLYPQQQMLFPGNLTLQHAGMTGPTLQSIGAAQGLSLQLQAKAPLDNKSGNVQNIQPVTNKPGMAVNAGTMMTASGQVLSAAPKANFPQQMMATPGKSTIIHSQSGFAPANANQTVVIGQLGVLPNQQSIFNHKAIAESQKGKTYTFQNSPAALQPKSLYSSGMPVHSSAQVFNGGHLKQISSQPQIITTQAPGNVLNQAQLFGLQTLGASLPPGLSWATPGCLQSSALLAQNPIIIRSSQESNMFIQSQPQTAMHLPVAAATQAVPPTSFASNVSVPQKQKQVRVRPGTQTVAVATQTIVSSAATVNSNTAPIRTQIKPKAPKLLGAPGPTLLAPQMATTQTQTNQSPPQAIPQNVAQSTSPLINHQKSDASNQTPTNQVNERKPLITYSRVPVSEAKPQQIPPVLTSTVHVSTSVSTVDTVSSTMPSVSRVPPRVQGSMPEPECETTKSPSVSTEPLNNSVASQETEPMEVPVQEAEEVLKSSQQPIVQPPSEQVPSENEHLKPHQPIMKPSLGQVKEKQPQKAIVKPQVLTHVIDGFLIQEGPEPFPVRSALLDSPCRILPPEKLESNQKRKDLPAVSPEKKLKVHRGRGNVELAKCEFCGKLGPKNKFKRSKRFCSTSCAKRYNVCCSKRVGLLHPVNQANVAAGPGRRRKMLRGRKGMRKQVQVEENEDINTTAKEEVASVADDESSTFSNKTEDETTEMQTDSPDLPPVSSEKEIEMQKIESIPPSQKLPTKWSVQDVYEFIRDTPGCSEYAETFRSQEIDGQALLLLKDHHLMTSMCMKLGPALKLIEQINKLTDEFGHP